MIPKVIHYCWFGNAPLPREVSKCIESWKRICPEYEIIQWNESNFDIASHPFMKVAYDCKAWAFVSDYARIKVIYDHGGIYLDTDVELLRSFDPYLKYDSFFAVQQVGCYCATGLGFGAQKGNDILEMMLSEYDDIEFDNDHRFDFRCPYLNTKAMLKKGFEQKNELQIVDNNILLPSKYMDPVSPGGQESLLCDDTISIHHYAAMWMPEKYQFKRRVVKALGQERVNKITRFIKRLKRKEK